MNNKRPFDIFADNDSDNVGSPTFEKMLKYQKLHLEMIKNYSKEIEFINKLLRDNREERNKFVQCDLPNIRKKLIEEHIDESIRNEWLIRLEKAIMHSFDESDKLAAAFAVQKEHEFNEALKEKLEKL